ncbi:unnamed protein product [Euphydryas editha]|uniref:C2H2-type domain-containing protein n=1 Tax=Euphydryas editha TaxID=104508 RepID=A0AAU9TB09_EUPED|nr:unnamed protein product [Euphydryas editha]
MCWECRAVLRNSEKFLLKAIKSHEFLNGYSTRTVQVESLSNLSTVFINCYEIKEVREDSETETNLKSNELSSQVEIELKEENSTNDEKFDDDYEDVKEDFEIERDIKNEIEISTNNEDFKVDIKDETKVETEEETKENTKDKTREEKMQSMKTKFKIINLTDEDVDLSKAYKIVAIDDKERLYWMERDKTARNYRTMAYKCELCITGYAKKKYYDMHLAKFHSKSSGKFECEICMRKYKDKTKLTDDIRKHFIKYVCLLCDYEDRRSWKLKWHIKTHKRAVMCLTCGLKFGTHHNFYEHYRRLHSKVICDYCGKKWNKKQRLIKHIKLRHSQHRCEICNRNYMSFDALTNHNKIHHVLSRTEESYCVECNIQFDNITKYTVHLKTSVKHKTYPGVPCPVCNKVYQKKCYMTNHYRHVHLKKTPHYCDKCSRYFLNSYRLRLHKERTHDKIPPAKDKMCSHCGRGFATNRILNNHIRTHTGERPFECDICSAKFAQKTALTVHRRSIHKLK